MSSKWREKGFFGTAKLALKFEDNHSEPKLRISLGKKIKTYFVFWMSVIFMIFFLNASSHLIDNLWLNWSKIQKITYFLERCMQQLWFKRNFLQPFIIHKLNCWCTKYWKEERIYRSESTIRGNSMRNFLTGLCYWKRFRSFDFLSTWNGWISEWFFFIMDHSVYPRSNSQHVQWSG